MQKYNEDGIIKRIHNEYRNIPVINVKKIKIGETFSIPQNKPHNNVGFFESINVKVSILYDDKGNEYEYVVSINDKNNEGYAVGINIEYDEYRNSTGEINIIIFKE